MNLEDLPEILTPEEIAKFLRLDSGMEVKALCRENKIGYQLIRRKYRIRKHHLITYLETNEKCQSVIPVPTSNGGRKGKSMKSGGLSAAREDAVRRALLAAQTLKNS